MAVGEAGADRENDRGERKGRGETQSRNEETEEQEGGPATPQNKKDSDQKRQCRDPGMEK